MPRTNKLTFVAWEHLEKNPPQYDPKVHKYLVWGYEKCPSTGKMHYQGYVEFYEKKMPRDYGARAETMGLSKKLKFIKARGTAQENYDYCRGFHKSKGFKLNEVFEEHGEPMTQGTRSDHDTIFREMINEKKKCSDIMLENPAFYCRYRNGLRDIEALIHKPQTREYRKGVWYYGQPRNGKSTWVQKQYPGSYFANADSSWFSKYHGEKIVILDEFSPESFRRIGIAYLLKLMSSTPMILDNKCNDLTSHVEQVIVVSNYSLETCMQDLDETRKKAFRGRFKTVQIKDEPFPECNEPETVIVMNPERPENKEHVEKYVHRPEAGGTAGPTCAKGGP